MHGSKKESKKRTMTSNSPGSKAYEVFDPIFGSKVTLFLYNVDGTQVQNGFPRMKTSYV